MLTSGNRFYYYHLLGLALLIYFVIFIKLDAFHMRWWDESMFAVNTYEMMHRGNYFSLYFDGAPDLYNTKPPLTVWLQLASVKAFGYNETALRLPSAIASAFTVLLLFHFIAKRHSLLFAWISALVLLTSNGFIDFHTSRTADSDAILTFFVFAATTSFLIFVFDDNRKYILLFFVCLLAAFATKLYAAFLFAPSYLLILLLHKKLKRFITNTFFFLGFFILISLGTGLLYAREIDSPGYIHQILFKDAGRVFSVIENHSASSFFYLDNFFEFRFSTWFFLLSMGFVLAFFAEDYTIKKILKSFAILIGSYLTLISISATKLIWYDMPLYPLFSVIAAYPIYLLVHKLTIHQSIKKSSYTVVAICAIFCYPYWMMFRKSEANELPNGEKILEVKERYLFQKGNEKANLNGLKVYYTGYKGSLLFYKYKLAEMKQHIELTQSDVYKLHDKILVSDDSLLDILNAKYSCTILEQFNNAQVVQIEAIK